MIQNTLNNSSKSVVIIGGGIGGLFSAWQLLKKGFKVTILERQNHLGGLSTSISYNEFKMDVGPHFVTTLKNTELTDELKELMSDEIISVEDIHKWYRVFFNNSVLHEYPPLYEIIFKNGKESFAKSLLSYFIAKIRCSLSRSEYTSAKEYVVCNYGNYIYKNWFRPYLDFYYGKNKNSIKTVQGKFPPLKIKDVFKKVRKRSKKISNQNNSSKVNQWYFKNGIGSLANRLTKNIETLGGEIMLSTNITNIEHSNSSKEISILQNNGEKKLFADIVLYTTPATVTKNWFKDYNHSDGSLKNSFNGIVIYLFIDSPKIVDWWLLQNYEQDFSFFRITQQNYLSDFISPPGKSLLCIEINTKDKDYLWELKESELITKIKNEIDRMKIFDIQKIEDYKIFKFKNLYVINGSIENSVSQKILHIINSFKNEFMIGAAIDPGTLVTKRVEDLEKSDTPVSLGGMYLTLDQSKKITQKIINQNNSYNKN